MTKKYLAPIFLLVFAAALISCSKEEPQTKAQLTPFVKQLPADSIHYVPLAEAASFESGCVALQPGDSGSEHSTKSWQEMLVVLKGQGEVILKGGENLPISAGKVAYIPQQTTHQIHCTGDSALQYVYIAAKTVE